jgi:4-alpha-glucanotransferase
MPLPYAYKKNSVVYTGTHDNDTIMGWFNRANEEDKVNAQRYCVLTEEEGYNWGFIRTAYATACDTAIIPMQDILGLLSEHRMNIPSVVGGNWSYRLDPCIDLSECSKKLKELCEIYRR